MKELLVLLEDQLHARGINLHILTGICAGLHRPDGAAIADKMLCTYAAARDQLCPGPRASSFFVSTRGTPLIYHCVHTTFAQLLTRTGITAPAGTRAPTIHGLRHSFGP